jgi:2-oxo-4-hydroxy-4-carboxy--5-ureidoimidazoline (OHCU) decarboxylase
MSEVEDLKKQLAQAIADKDEMVRRNAVLRNRPDLACNKLLALAAEFGELLTDQYDYGTPMYRFGRKLEDALK